jgi:hypothetical protein
MRIDFPRAQPGRVNGRRWLEATAALLEVQSAELGNANDAGD